MAITLNFPILCVYEHLAGRLFSNAVVILSEHSATHLTDKHLELRVRGREAHFESGKNHRVSLFFVYLAVGLFIHSYNLNTQVNTPYR